MNRARKSPAALCVCALAWVFGLVLAGCSPESGSPVVAGVAGRSALMPVKPLQGQSFTITGLGMEMQPVPAGTFQMGSPYGEPGRTAAESPQTLVTITRPFWLGRTTVTHDQWRTLMGTDLAAQAKKAFPGESNPARFLAGTDDEVAMYFVSWREAMEFCEKLNACARSEGSLPAGYEFTLPTEAQWEYACRAGTTGATYAGPMHIQGENNAPILDTIAWYGGNSSVGFTGPGWDTAGWNEKQYPGGGAGPRHVGLKQPNAWGLCDMLGNVYQWCRDYPTDALPGDGTIDPAGPASGSDHIVRGGSWHSEAAFCRSAYRAWSIPDGRLPFIGFRVALAPQLNP